MRILYVASGRSFFSDRPTRKVEAIVRCWREMGHEVELLSGGDVLPPRRQEQVRQWHAAGARTPWFRRLPGLQPAVDTVSEWRDMRHDRRLRARVEARIRDFRPDLYWQRSARLDGGTFAAAGRAGLPRVLEWKDNLLEIYGASLFKPWAAWGERRKDRSADWVVVESGVLRDRLAPRRPDGARTVFVAHNAIHPADFALDAAADRSECRRRLGLAEGELCVVYAGSFAWYHHVEVLIDALAREPRLPLRVLLVGDGPGRPAAERRARERGVEERIRFVGRVPAAEVPVWLAASNAAVLPECTDIITPIKVLEYMATGLPSVIPDHPANREVVETGETGLLFSPRDPKALHDALAELVRDPERGARIGRAARERALARFSFRSTWGRVLEEIGARAGLLPGA